MNKKEKVDKLLRKAHLIINEASGLDISKTTKEKAKIEARKVWKQIKDIDPKVWEVLKAELT
mgnify:CR=1 FL=1